MYHVATSWDESGHSPSQEQIDNSIENLKNSPSTHSYNVCCWQPHLVNSKLTSELWDWIEYYVDVKLEFSSMRLADKQVWWLISPEPKKFEDDSDFKSKEIFFHRQQIVDQIKNPFTFHKQIDEHWHAQRAMYPRIYMQVQSVIDHMHREYSFVPIALNKVTQFPIEFNYEFGHHFNNVPVIPVTMTTFYSKPKTVKHNGTDREVLSTNDGSLKAFKTYPAPQINDGQGRVFVDTYWWESHENPMASKLTRQECINLYNGKKKDKRPIRTFDQLRFNLSADLI